MKSLSACMPPPLQSRLANLGVHTHEISALHPPKYLAPTLSSLPPEPDIRRAGSPPRPLPFESSPPVSLPRPWVALEEYLQPATPAPLSQPPVRLKARKQYQQAITSPAPQFTIVRVISINFRKSKDSKESIILKYPQEGYDIILCQELKSPPQVRMALASGMDLVRIYHNTTGRARSTAVVVGPALSRYSKPLPTFKDAHGLLAACTVTPSWAFHPRYSIRLLPPPQTQ